MAKRYRDFDAYFGEQTKEPVTLTLFGEKHELPAALPAGVVLKIVRLQRDNGGIEVVPHGELFDMAYDIFGQGRIDEWCKKGLDVEQLGELIKWVMEVYTGRGEDEDEEGKNEEPTTA